ncbi:Receptor-like protein kinase like protein [Zostera marina]|uniref:Receptor-like serine/threonine-protein kinase n=1 Tax=Zostera marina TaxID=29655 RepID=A0A0K9PXR7_ZOSMR|nr:Receptor-like protein kinase like protein [Zostera marina]
MALHRFLFFLLLHVLRCSGGPLYQGSIAPNYTVSHLLNVDHNGVFLNSPNSTYHASMCNPAKQQLRFYLCVVHKNTHTIVWSANASSPVSSSGKLKLSPSGITISAGDDVSDVVWSFYSDRTVSALRLHDSGNLVLVDKSNVSLWESFHHPTDTFVSGQRIVSGGFLTSSVSDSDLMPGDYKMVVSESDVILEWSNGQRYWAFSSDLETRNYIPAAKVSYMMMNGSGIFLFDPNSRVMSARSLPSAKLRFGKIDKHGHFVITSYEMDSSSEDIHGSGFTAPTSACDLPFACSTLGVCTPGKTAKCSCPPGFRHLPTESTDCVPSDGSSLAADSDNCDSSIHFKQLPTNIRYFDSKFQSSGISNLNITSCRLFCSNNCTCLGFYYTNSSKYCSFLQKKLGSLIFDDDDSSDTRLYIKIVPGDIQSILDNNNRAFLLPILLPSIALVLLVIVIGLLLLRYLRKERNPKYDSSFIKKSRFGCRKKHELPDEDDDDIPILGLPTRFTYAKLEESTEGFSQQIGSGGFGEVFKGTLPDKTTVAVKRITNMGVQGKKEFCTEIAVIGKIHHVNLVKLRGFCAQGSRRLLVYEFMNRSSLDRSLFNVGGRPVLEWEERVQIAIGASRGLSYLHTSCDNTILHCDIKPENILLHDHNGVKIADFGLAKLLRPEQSNLFTTMRGTRGYLAPEWLTNSAISDRTDVYSFGMVLLEILHGRKNCVSIPDRNTPFAATDSGWIDGSLSSPSTMPVVEESYFPLIALEKHEEDNYGVLADPRLEGRVTTDEVKKMVKIALCCLHEEPYRRPSMVTVAGMLEGTIPVMEPRVMSLNFLRVYGRDVVRSLPATMAAVTVTTSNNSSDAEDVAVSYHQSAEQVSGPR